MELLKNERIDYVNDRLSLIQKTDGLTFGTDALLLAGYIPCKAKRAAELGGGSGIISMLALARDKAEHVDCYEVQREYASLIKRNAELNSLTERLCAVHEDIRNYRGADIYDAVYSNPPYMKATSGKANTSDAKNIARHEIEGGIYDFISAARAMLKWGGSLSVVYRPDRLIDLVHAMRECQIEPKRMTFVHADRESVSSIVLLEGRRAGGAELYLTPPLMIYKDNTHGEYSDDMKYIMENGVFPSKYIKR